MFSVDQATFGFIAKLKNLGLFRASGEDAISFMHGQLSNDIAGMKENQARIAGYCTPQGRLLAVFLVWRSGKDIWLLAPREIIPGLLKRLKMYVLRAKVLLEDMTEDFTVAGIAGRHAVKRLVKSLPDISFDIFEKTQDDSGVLIRQPNAFGDVRFLWVMPRENWLALRPSLESFPLTADEAWELGDVECALPQVYAPTQNRFIPQMLNMQEVGGLSFTKGCYPGQEVVARVQYRANGGRQYMVAACVDAPGDCTAADVGIVPGMDVFDPAAPAEPCGIVVRAARRDLERVDCLLVVSREQAPGSHALCLSSPDGLPLQSLPLPYEIKGIS